MSSWELVAQPDIVSGPDSQSILFHVSLQYITWLSILLDYYTRLVWPSRQQKAHSTWRRLQTTTTDSVFN